MAVHHRRMDRFVPRDDERDDAMTGGLKARQRSAGLDSQQAMRLGYVICA